MKKAYLSPKVDVVELDIEGLCLTPSPTGGLGNGDGLGNQIPEGDDDDNCFSASYRTNLWN